MGRPVRPALAALLFLGGVLFLSGGASAEAAEEKGDLETTGRKWAFCVGIGDYRDPEIMDLPKARNDAKGLARVLEEHGGFEEVLALTDDLEERSPLFPSSGHFRKLLHQAARKIQKEDTVLFSFSGHGVNDSSGRGYLLMADTRLRSPYSTGIPLETVLDFLKKTGVKRSILLIDAASEKVYKRGGFSPEGIYPDRYLRKGVTALFYAANKGYYSHEDSESGYGVFARSLIRGLEGGADREYGGDKDGVVSLAELASYVDLALTDWSLKGPLTQVPFTEIVDSDKAFGMISSVKKIKVAKAPPTDLPSWLEVSPRKKKEPDRKIAAKDPPKKADQQKKAKEAEKVKAAEAPAPREPAKPPGARESTPAKEPKPAAVVGAPAPRISDLIKDEKAGGPREEGGTPRCSDRGREGGSRKGDEERGSSAGRGEGGAPGKVPGTPPEGRISRRRGCSGEAPKDRKPPERVASVPPEGKKDVLRLRSRGKDLSTQEVKSMLTSRKFYATCWNYNGDFCNPDGEFENAFRDNGDGTVTDAATGLMWQKGGSDDAVTWVGAKEYADKSNQERFAGYADWRIPTAEEMASLLESSWKNSDLFIDPVFDRRQRQCWCRGHPGHGVCLEGQLPHGFPHGFPHDIEELRAPGAHPPLSRWHAQTRLSVPRLYLQRPRTLQNLRLRLYWV